MEKDNKKYTWEKDVENAHIILEKFETTSSLALFYLLRIRWNNLFSHCLNVSLYVTDWDSWPNEKNICMDQEIKSKVTGVDLATVVLWNAFYQFTLTMDQTILS